MSEHDPAQHASPETMRDSRRTKDNAQVEKKCLLIVVDAIAHRIVWQAIKEAKLPVIAEMVRQGGKLSKCLSIFPSITPAATCSLATGAYPAEHGIEGAFWFDQDKDEIAYFGDDWRLLRERGLHQFLIDFGDRLNNERLQTPTIFERLEQLHIESACVNYMWFRASTRHARRTPLTLRLMAGSLSESVHGPKYLKLGDFVEGLPDGVSSSSMLHSGPLARYGFNDATTGLTLLSWVENAELPPFTLAYFPENDDESHQQGPENAADTALTRFDRWLGDFVEAVGGWEALRNGYAMAIVGDHGQNTMTSNSRKQAIRLDEILGDYEIASFNSGWQPGEEMFICPNMRAAAIHLRREADADAVERRHEVTKVLLRDDRIDQVIYPCSPDGGLCQNHRLNNRWFRVATRDRGGLLFALSESVATPTVAMQTPVLNGVDAFANAWKIVGDLRALDLHVNDGQLIDGKYPNSLERIAGAYEANRSPVFVTAREGYEFCVAETNVHPGGSHGSLCSDDAEAALITFGTQPIPDVVRSIDVLGLCLRELDGDARKSPSQASHGMTTASN